MVEDGTSSPTKPTATIMRRARGLSIDPGCLAHTLMYGVRRPSLAIFESSRDSALDVGSRPTQGPSEFEIWILWRYARVTASQAGVPESMGHSDAHNNKRGEILDPAPPTA